MITRNLPQKIKAVLIKISKLTAMAVLIVLIMTASGSNVCATGQENPRAIAMAGAYTSLARGFHAPSFNPANLGFESGQMNGVELFGLGVAISNNSFSLADYNNYTGAHLSQSDKDELLGKIPAEGLKLSADIEASILAVGLGSFAFSISAIGAAEVNIGRAPMELLLNGNSFAEVIDFGDMYGEGYGLGSFNVSYGRQVYKNLDRKLAVGGTFRLLKGFGYEEVTELDGQIVTLSTGFDGQGDLVARTATGGSGYAIDIGSSMQLTKNYTVGLTLFNALSNVNWNNNPREYRYTFKFDTVTVANMGTDSLFTSSDTTIDIADFSTGLPRSFKIGLAKTTGKMMWAVDWEQGFKKGAGTSAKPRISAGAEYHALSFLPLRTGFAVGGKRGTTFAAGFGFDFSVFYLDLAAANYNAISGSSGKGLNFAFASGFRF